MCVFTLMRQLKSCVVPKWAAGRRAGVKTRQEASSANDKPGKCNRTVTVCVWGIKSRIASARWKMRMERKTFSRVLYVLNGELVRAAVFAANRTYPWHGHAPLAQLLLIHTWSTSAHSLSVHSLRGAKSKRALKNKRTTRSLIQQAQSALCVAKTAITRQKAERTLSLGELCRTCWLRFRPRRKSTL